MMVFWSHDFETFQRKICQCDSQPLCTAVWGISNPLFWEWTLGHSKIFWEKILTLYFEEGHSDIQTVKKNSENKIWPSILKTNIRTLGHSKKYSEKKIWPSILRMDTRKNLREEFYVHIYNFSDTYFLSTRPSILELFRLVVYKKRYI